MLYSDAYPEVIHLYYDHPGLLKNSARSQPQGRNADYSANWTPMDSFREADIRELFGLVNAPRSTGSIPAGSHFPASASTIQPEPQSLLLPGLGMRTWTTGRKGLTGHIMCY